MGPTRDRGGRLRSWAGAIGSGWPAAASRSELAAWVILRVPEDEESPQTPSVRCPTNRPSSEDCCSPTRQMRRPDSSPKKGALPLRDSTRIAPDFAALAVTPERISGAVQTLQARLAAVNKDAMIIPPPGTA